MIHEFWYLLKAVFTLALTPTSFMSPWVGRVDQ